MGHSQGKKTCHMKFIWSYNNNDNNDNVNNNSNDDNNNTTFTIRHL